MSALWEIEAAVSPIGVLINGSAQLLVRVQIVDLDNADPAAAAFIDLSPTQARRIALEILAAADDADWQDRPARLPAAGAGTMSARQHASPAAATAVPARARALAARLAGLFDQDQQIVVRLNDAHHRLAAANDQLRTDPLLGPLRARHEIHSAFCAYQHASEERRALAVDVGELSQQLADAMTAAGHTPEQARSANVHQLAAGTWQPSTTKEKQQ